MEIRVQGRAITELNSVFRPVFMLVSAMLKVAGGHEDWRGLRDSVASDITIKARRKR